MSNGPERVYIDKYSADVCAEREPDDVEYIRADLAMCWTPIAEADLQDGEDTLLLGRLNQDGSFTFIGGGLVEWHEDGQHFEHYALPKRAYYDMNDGITHILRIKPPSGMNQKKRSAGDE